MGFPRPAMVPGGPATIATPQSTMDLGGLGSALDKFLNTRGPGGSGWGRDVLVTALNLGFFGHPPNWGEIVTRGMSRVIFFPSESHVCSANETRNDMTFFWIWRVP